MEDKYQIDSAQNKAFLKLLRDELVEFGRYFPSPEGSSYYLGDDGSPWTDRPRETWITSRMAHVYSIASMLGYDGADKLADKAIMGLKGELHDNENGGWYAGINPDGSILPDKQCYAHAFVILAASSAYLAGRPGARVLLDEALELYDRYFWNEEAGLSVDTWNTEFTRLDPYRGINANMHTAEAFLAVYDALGSKKYLERAGRIIDHVVEWATANSYRIPEHFNENWIADLMCNKDNPADRFKPFGATPGHGIEWARLISQYATSASSLDKDTMPYINVATKLFDQAIMDAWYRDGAPGICYTTDWSGKPVVHDRMHWTLAEAINTSAILYKITGNKKYGGYYFEFMKYLDEKVIDHEKGSWFHQLDSNNRLLTTVWPGKSDIYHAFQATIIPYGDVNVSVASWVRRNI